MPDKIVVQVNLFYDGVAITEQWTVCPTVPQADSLHGYIDEAVTQIKKRLI